MTYSLREKNSLYFVPLEELVHEVRAALVCQACEMAFRGQIETAREFIGLNIENWGEPDLRPETLAKVDLRRFPAASRMDLVHSYAYQIGDERARALFCEEDLHESEFIKEAFESARRVTGTSYIAHHHVRAIAQARYRLQDDWRLGAKDLATLSGLKEEAVRASLKAEGLRKKGDRYVEPDLAEAWLRRRGFKPTLLPEDVGISAAAMTMEFLLTRPFHMALNRGIYLIRDSVRTVAANARVDEEWLYAVLQGVCVIHDEKALTRVAVHLGVDVDLFVSRALEELQGDY